MEASDSSLIDHTAAIVTAYVAHNAVNSAGIADIIKSVHDALHMAAISSVEPEKDDPIPAVPIKKSVTADYIICLEDGKRFKSLRRHLSNHFGMSPEQYRAKWNLPNDYPMVAPSYAAARSALAIGFGLGKKSHAGYAVKVKKC